MRKKNVRTFLLALLAVMLIVQVSVLVNNHFLSAAPVVTHAQSPLPDVPLSLDGYERAQVTVSPSVIYLTAGCRQLAMVTTNMQTYSIQTGLKKKVNLRPTTHDIIRDMIDGFGMKVKMARVERLQDSTYYATLFVRQGNMLLSLDSKPSDAIAVAIRVDAPVYVSSRILESAGKNVC